VLILLCNLLDFPAWAISISVFYSVPYKTSDDVFHYDLVRVKEVGTLLGVSGNHSHNRDSNTFFVHLFRPRVESLRFKDTLPIINVLHDYKFSSFEGGNENFINYSFCHIKARMIL